MIKLKTKAVTLTANQIIPLDLVFNTNNSFGLEDNKIVVKKAGFIEVEGTITMIATAEGDVQIRLIDEEGNILSKQNITFAEIGNYGTIPVYDLLRIVYSTNLSFEKLALQVNTGVSINNGEITAKYIE